jgi:ABC-type Fe3+-hydroxamate transport system substrate-binding protein
MKRWFAVFCLASILFMAGGCSKNSSQNTSDQNSMPPMMQQQSPMAGMPMMKENPLSIKEVTGEIQEVNQKEMIVFTTKGVTLRFGITKDTIVVPKGKKLVPGLKVKIHIQHVPQGMNAGEVDILK